MENILIPGGKLELNEITANKEKNTISYLSQIYDIDVKEEWLFYPLGRIIMHIFIVRQKCIIAR